MMYIHYCANCNHIHILNGHKKICPACENKLKELNISYMDYVNLLPAEREKLMEKLNDLTL